MKCGESQDIHMAVEFGLYKEDQVVIQPSKEQQCTTNLRQIFNRFSDFLKLLIVNICGIYQLDKVYRFS